MPEKRHRLGNVATEQNIALNLLECAQMNTANYLVVLLRWACTGWFTGQQDTWTEC